MLECFKFTIGTGKMYFNDVKTVSIRGKNIGFIVRRSFLYGISDRNPNGWMITLNILNPMWVGNYSTRRAARVALQNLRELASHGN